MSIKPHLTAEQEQVLRHMLGIDRPEDRIPLPYRNYYCTDAADPVMRDLSGIGMVEHIGRHFGYEAWSCTAAGREAAIRSHRKIRWPRKRRLYLRYLDMRDVMPGLSFREFLTGDNWAETRRGA